jgi:hypothetical protein
MTSAAKIAANRRNAQMSTGPRTSAGKARVRRNAWRHGLSVQSALDPSSAKKIGRLARTFAGSGESSLVHDLASRAAQAQFDVARIRLIKVALINQTAARLRSDNDVRLSTWERVALAFVRKAQTLAAFERYERRALSRRNRALRELRVALTPFERVGPPRPKKPRGGNRFVQTVAKLELRRVLGVRSPQPPLRLFEGTWHMTWREPSHDRLVNATVRVKLDGNRGSLAIANCGQEVEQVFALTGTPMGVGGIRSHITCPETAKRVRALYLLETERTFRSRHALALVYNSSRRGVLDRRLERYWMLADRIGASWDDWKPPRPKYMHRRTYDKTRNALVAAKGDLLRWALGRSDGE